MCVYVCIYIYIYIHIYIYIYTYIGDAPKKCTERSNCPA